MTRDGLVASARELPLPAPAAAEAYAAACVSLAAAVTARLRAREDVASLVGPGNDAMMADNHENHGRFIASLLAVYQPEILVDTVLWVFRAYRAHGFSLAYWPAQLAAWIAVMGEQLPPQEAAAVLPLYEWMLRHQAAFVALSDDALRGDSPLPPAGG